MIIQSPTSLKKKRFDAEEHIGKNLLIFATCKNGFVIGKKFNSRQDKPLEGIILINPQIIIAGIGDLRDYKSTASEIIDFSQGIAKLLGKHYITGEGIVTALSNYLQRTFEEEATARAVNFLVADFGGEDSLDLWFVDFDGHIKKLKDFAVAGGIAYKEDVTLKDLKKLSEKDKKVIKKEQKIDVNETITDIKSGLEWEGTIDPRKNAISLLEKNWKKNMKTEETMKLVGSILKTHNPLKDKNHFFEVVAFEDGKEPSVQYFGVKNFTKKTKKK